MLLICRCHSNATVIGSNRVGEREHSSWCSTRVRCGRSKVARLVFADVSTKLQPRQFGEASQTFGDQRTGSRCKPVQSVELVCAGKNFLWWAHAAADKVALPRTCIHDGPCLLGYFAWGEGAINTRSLVCTWTARSSHDFRAELVK